MRAKPDPNDLAPLFNLAQDMLCVAGFDGYFKRLNPAWERTLGFTEAELTAKPYLDFVHPDDREATIAAGASVQTGAKVIRFRNRYLAKDGTYRWLSWNAVPFPDGQLVYAVARDITDGKRHEIRQAAAYAVTRVLATATSLDTAATLILRAICEGLDWSIGAIWSWDREASALRCIQLWHAASVEAPKFVEMTRKAIFPAGIGLPGRVWSSNHSLWLPNVVQDSNFPRAAVAESEGLHGAFGFPIRGSSEVIGVIEFFSREFREPDSDVLQLFDSIGSQIGQFIERRQADEKLHLYARELEVAQRKAQEATQAKSDFLANMSHEIRTPMNAIIGMTELALLTKLTKQQQQYLRTTTLAAESLMNLLTDVLDLSKIEARKLHIEHMEFNIRDTLDEAINLLALRAGEKALELACHVSGDTPAQVVGDSMRLRQVIVNLVGNAVKFTDRGEVVIRAGIETMSAGQAVLRFEVSDTGIGIPEEKRELIFEAFAQADSSTTRRYGGTGLGLAISSELVRLMGGRIWLDSAVGKGSTFSFTVPFGLSKNKAKTATRSLSALEGLRVLAVDDNATNRQILREILQSWRMKPVVSDSAAGALDTLRIAVKQKKPFHLAIFDGHMPDTDGFTLARRVKRDRTLSRTGIVMLTSAVSPEDAERCRKLRVAAYLNKPVRQSELLNAILTIFAGHAPRSNGQKTSRRQQQPAKRLKVLVAEDNPVNQQLMVHLLKRRGYTVKLVGNGKAALDSIAKDRFDVILMDIQMPVMGGLDAAAAIRKGERSSDIRIPIIATTAHAMPSDRSSVLHAGMDAYLAKPIHASELYETIENVTRAKGSAQPIDKQSLLDGLGGDRKILRKLTTIFLKDSQRMMREIRKAVNLRDSESLAASAHALKGAAANFGPNSTTEVARSLEQIGKAKRLDEAPPALDKLEREMIVLRRRLNQL